MVYEIFKNYSDLDLKVNGANLYRSKINGYRIKIPDNWLIEKGNTLGTEFHCRPSSDDALISVQVGTLKGLNNIPIEKFPIDLFLNTIKNRVDNLRVLKEEMTSLANVPTKHIQFEFELNHLNEKYYKITDYYITIRNDKFYNIMLQAHKSKYDNYHDEFYESLKSFWFEDYNK